MSSLGSSLDDSHTVNTLKKTKQGRSRRLWCYEGTNNTIMGLRGRKSLLQRRCQRNPPEEEIFSTTAHRMEWEEPIVCGKSRANVLGQNKSNYCGWSKMNKRRTVHHDV